MPNRKKYSEKLAKQIAGLVAEDEHSITEICQMTGISRRVYYNWLAENAQMQVLIERSEKILHLKKLEEITSESRNGLAKLLKGFEITTEKKTTRYFKDGTARTTLTYTTKHISPDMTAILFVLKAKDSKNFKSRAQRLVNVRFKAINREAQKDGRILSDYELDALISSGALTQFTNLQTKSNETRD